jgi:hypothetical protein
MTTIAVVPPSASDLDGLEEIKTPISTIDQKDNETNKFSNWGADYEVNIHHQYTLTYSHIFIL